MNVQQMLGLAMMGFGALGVVAPDQVRGSSKVGGKPMSRETTRMWSGALAAAGAFAYFRTGQTAPATSSNVAMMVAPTGTRPFGDPNATTSVAFACNTAYKLQALGHPREAAAWAQLCTQGGGAVPTSAATEYT